MYRPSIGVAVHASLGLCLSSGKEGTQAIPCHEVNGIAQNNRNIIAMSNAHYSENLISDSQLLLTAGTLSLR